MTVQTKSGEDCPTVEDFIGSFRTFGDTGPLYEVVGKVDSTNLLVRLIHSGEEVEYPVKAAAEDPIAK